jgi:hypothetical protein
MAAEISSLRQEVVASRVGSSGGAQPGARCPVPVPSAADVKTVKRVGLVRRHPADAMKRCYICILN